MFGFCYGAVNISSKTVNIFSHTYAGQTYVIDRVRNFRRRNFRRQNFRRRIFRRTEFSPKWILDEQNFVARKFRRTEFSPSVISPNGIFAEHYDIMIQKMLFLDMNSVFYCEIVFVTKKLTCAQTRHEVSSHKWVTTSSLWIISPTVR